MATVQVENMEDLNPEKMLFSEKKRRSWNFTDKSTGEQKQGGENYAFLYYNTPGQKLAFSIKDLRTFQGILTKEGNFKTGSMPCPLTTDKSAEIRKCVDQHILALCYKYKDKLWGAKAKKVLSLEAMMPSYHGVVTDGKEKKENPEETWPDSLFCDVPLKRGKGGQQVIVDDNLCQIEDLDEKPYSWTALDGKNLKEVVVEVQKVVFGEVIRVKCMYRLISVDDKVQPKYTTKRRLEQEEKKKEAKKRKASQEAAAPESTENGSSSSSSSSSVNVPPPPPAKRQRVLPTGTATASA